VAAATRLFAMLQRGKGAFASMVKHLPRDTRGLPTRLASVALTPQASVHVVQWQGQEFLLGCTQQQLTVLSQRALGEREQA
jgi:flagellar biogenesis protein FliO